MRSVGLRVPQSWLLTAEGWLAGAQPAGGTRVIIKPIYESVGIGVDDDSVQIVDGTFDDFMRERAAFFGQPAIVQEFITGEEVGVPLARLDETYALLPVVMRQADGEPDGLRTQNIPRRECAPRPLAHAL